MFSCSECGKRYASLYSLNRHAQNHLRLKQHTCHECHVSFYRRDLLSRHQAMHQASRSSTPKPETSAQPRRARLRRHTACIRCAELRRKCSGGNPCAPCSQSGYTCQFPTSTGRMSRPIAHIDSNDSNHSGHLGVAEQLLLPDSTVHDTADALDSFSEDCMETRTSRPSQISIGQPRSPTVDATLVDGQINPMVHFGNLDSWAWMHESMYLQPDDLICIADQNASYATSPIAAPENDTAVVSQAGTLNEQISVFITQHMETSASRQRQVPNQQMTQPTSSHTSPTDASFATRREVVVDELVAYAASELLVSIPYHGHAEYWSVKSQSVCDAFDLSLPPQQQTAIRHFLDLYLLHFWPLWPVLAKQDLDVDSLHPLLCLVLSSIGAMYGGHGSVAFGCMMHNKARTYLTLGFELDDSEHDFTWLAQARLYTQVAALYFGQAKAFTYGQHLGALLIAQARRMGLYSSDLYDRAHQNFNMLKSAGRNEERLAIWLQLEGRRRLAFGIFRADTYASVLLDTPPLLSMEEMDVTFPCCDAVWRSDTMPIEVCLHMIDHDRSPCRHLRASELYHIAVDPDELLPVLEPVAHELLQFGLQGPLGRFSHKHSTLPFLTDPSELSSCYRTVCDPAGDISISAETTQSMPLTEVQTSVDRRHDIPRESSSLATAKRKWHRLNQEYRYMLQSQRKWEEALPVVKTFLSNANDRSSLMSGLVLFHLGRLRLHAPISKLHQLQYRLSEHRSLESLSIASLKEWTTSASARTAALHSCSLFSLVAGEINENLAERVQFNLLAFIGLYHATVILWSYMDSCSSTDAPSSNDIYIELPGKQKLLVSRRNSKEVLQAFVTLFYNISPGSWSSFAEAAAPLMALSVPWQSCC